MSLTPGQNFGRAAMDVTDADGRKFVRPSEGTADTAIAIGQASAPGANGVLASLSGLTPGAIYKVVVAIIVSGTAETTMTNGVLRTNGAAVTGSGGTARLPTPNGVALPVTARVTCGANGVIDVATAGAATAGSIYLTSLAATRIE